MLNKIKKVVSTVKYLQFLGFATFAAPVLAQDPTIQVNELMALLFLLMGALAWVSSGGNKENVDKARDKITAAIVGLVLIVAVLALIVTMEQIVFGNNLCLGLSCPITIPPLLQPAP